MSRVVEPRITINGRALSTGQAMAVRVAVSAYIVSLLDDGLGDDEHGLVMVRLYLARLGEVLALIGAE